MNSPESRSGMVVLTGNSHPVFANMVVDRMGIRLGECNVVRKAGNGNETSVDIRESVRNKDVFIIQSGSNSINDDIMELLIMIYTCRTSSARQIAVIMPYMPYSRQCRQRRRGAIPAKLTADLICRAGANRIITIDFYKKEIQGFFTVPVDNLRASPFLLQYLKENIPLCKSAVIVAKNPAATYKATSYAERLRLGIAVIHGEHKELDTGSASEVDGRNSPYLLVEEAQASYTPIQFLPSIAAKEKPPLDVVGDVRGKVAIIVDDVIDETDSFVSAAALLKERGASRVFVVATHGLMSADAPAALENSLIDEVIVTNSVPQDEHEKQCGKVRVVDVSLLISEAIRRIYHNESMSHLFRDVTLND